MNDFSHPCPRTATLLGNPGVFVSSARQQNNSGMKPVDRIDQLSFHRFQFSAFVRPKRPCFYRVHVWFSTLSRLPYAACGEPIYNIINDGASLLFWFCRKTRNSITGNGSSFPESLKCLAKASLNIIERPPVPTKT